MKRFGIGLGFALGMIGAIFREEANEGGDAGAVNEPVKPNVKLDEGKGPEVKAPKEQPGDAEVLDKAGFAPGDDPGLNFALTFLAKNGFSADHPAVDAAFGGDFSLLKAELAGKGVTGWEQALALGEQAYGRAQEAHQAKEAEVGRVVTEFAEAVGVDWEEAVSHISGNSSAEEKAALNQLLADPATAKIAASYITNSYMETGGGEREPVQAVNQEGSMTQRKQEGGKITRAEYTKAMRELYQKHGENYMSTPEAQNLYRRLNG